MAEQERLRRWIFDLLDAAYDAGDVEPERRAVLEFAAVEGDPEAFRRRS